ncbi:MAG TPA: hypothetical protein PLO36_04875 [Methanofastidiosum sp.]|nr:hypothetical protein [Methanofastidiosum sp.]HPA49452.1 hypothetical protein [Methanofastidiosum sp.]HQK63403.1 hypothetical protein [Methanofastidiosum sp.]HQM95332.1 hypothetical protein [Methanofastidiosum sp.]HQQ49413.1 hypothetical protein [Methanofastidiosum sp.]
MKKVFAVLISMIFILSTLGVAAANGGCNCDRPNVIAPKTVTVGQEFVLLYKVECGSRIFTDSGSPNVSEYIQNISVYGESGYMAFKFKALKPGTIYFCDDQCSACDPSIYEFRCYTNCLTINIVKKSLPMDWIMKKFGLGKED